MEMKDQLSALEAELKTFVGKANDERTKHGTVLAETKSAIEKLQSQVDAIDVKLAEKQSNGVAQKSVLDQLKENEEVSRLLRNRSGRANFSVKSLDFGRKSIITSAGLDNAIRTYAPGIVPEARAPLTLRNLLTAVPTTAQIIDYLKVTNAPSAAVPVAETNLKPENAVNFAVASEKVRTIATFLPATKQILDDFSELAAFIENSLPYYVDLGEELEMLSGDGTGEHLHGFIAQATALDTTALVSGDNKVDVIAKAMAQITAAKELSPNFVVVNTGDVWKMRLLKDSQGHYLLGDPTSAAMPNLFGATVVATPNIAAGSFLVGSSAAPAAEIRDRQDVTVEISTEHADYFQRNMVAIRAEKRMALLVKRPGAYVTGSFGSH